VAEQYAQIRKHLFVLPFPFFNTTLTNLDESFAKRIPYQTVVDLFSICQPVRAESVGDAPSYGSPQDPDHRFSFDSSRWGKGGLTTAVADVAGHCPVSRPLPFRARCSKLRGVRADQRVAKSFADGLKTSPHSLCIISKPRAEAEGEYRQALTRGYRTAQTYGTRQPTG